MSPTTPNPTYRQPLDFSRAVPPESLGLSTQGVNALAALFERQLTDQRLHPAAQLVVLRHGQVLLDRALGEVRGRPLSPDTPFLTFSISKVFTAMAVHQLIEAGDLDLDAPIARYWPAFGVKGKATATLRHLFLHQAGVPTGGLRAHIPLWPFWPLLARAVANLPAEYPPGQRAVYHPLNYGFIFGELVPRVTGQPIDRFMSQHFFAPLGMANTWLRLPRDQLRRSPRLYAGGRRQRAAAWLFDRAPIRRALLPAASLHSSARDLAIFFQMLLNDGLYAGRRYLQADTIRRATALGYAGLDGDSGRQVRWAYGFHLGGLSPPPGLPGPTMGTGSTARTFGHSGNASCYVWADPDAQLVFAFTCNRLLDRPHSLARWTALSNALWDALRA